MIKVKHEQTADCVVAGFRRVLGDRPLVVSMLGLYDSDDATKLEHVGVVVGLPMVQRRQMFELLAPLRMSLAGHPWEHGFLTEGGAVERLVAPPADGRPT